MTLCILPCNACQKLNCFINLKLLIILNFLQKCAPPTHTHQHQLLASDYVDFIELLMQSPEIGSYVLSRLFTDAFYVDPPLRKKTMCSLQ